MTKKCANVDCTQQIFYIVDKREKPIKHTYHDKHLGVLTRDVSYPLIPHPSGLCYYCLKKSTGLIKSIVI